MIDATELEVRLIAEDDSRARRADGAQEVGARLVPRGVVRRADERDVRAWRCVEERVPVGLDPVPRLDPDRALRPGCAPRRVQLVGRSVHQRDAARPEAERGNEQDDLVAAGAHRDLIVADADESRDRLLERAVRASG